jgi:ubiquinone/menaquinone biosynthesis C-methylase UbiE
MAADAAISMLELARLNVEVAGLGMRIQLSHVDAKRMPYADAMFDVVMSNSIIHHIPDPQRVMSEAARVVRSGGLLFLRDLLRPTTEAELEQLVTTYAGKEIEHAQQMFRQSLHAALTLDEVRQLAQQIGVPSERVQQTSDRHWTLTARRE